MIEYDFPDYPDNCPPMPHVCPEGVYYRILKSENGPSEEDFKSNYERCGLSRSSDKCEDRGISIWNNLQSIRALKANWQNATKYGIIEVIIKDNAGVIHHREHRLPGHCTWWISAKVSPLSMCGKMVG